MAEELEKSLSVIIPTNCGALLTGHYLPQLCAHMEECDGVDDYEILVCDRGPEPVGAPLLQNLPHVRYLHSGPLANEVDNLNKAVFSATMNFVLVAEEYLLPTHNFFSQLFRLFHYVPSLFGASGTLLQGHEHLPEGPLTADDSKSGIVLKTVPPISRKPVYTLGLSAHNMLFLRKQLCLMGGFSDLFTQADFAKNDLSIRAWRSGRKCLFAPSAYCKKLETDSAPHAGNASLRQNGDLYNQLVLDYMHTSRLGHFLFWLRFCTGFVAVLPKNDASSAARKEAYRLFASQFRSKLLVTRRWNKHLRQEPLDKVLGGFFNGKQLQELNLND